MKQVFQYLKAYRRECVVAPLFKCLEACFDLCVPLCIAWLVDSGIRGADNGVVVKTGLILLALAAIGLACSFTAQWFAARAATGFAAKLRSVLFAHIQSLSFSTADSMGTDTLITRLTSDINQVQTGVNMGLRLLLRSPFIVFGAMIMAFTVDARAAVIFAVVIPLLALVVYGIMLINIPLYKKVQARLDNVLRLTRENLTGVRVIRAFNLQRSETERFTAENDSLTAANEYVGRFAALTNPVTYVLINLATVLLIYQGGLRVQAGELTQGQVIALVNYMAQILVELIKLANLIITITKAVAGAGRIGTVLATEPGMKEGSASAAELRGSVAFDHVVFDYNGDEEPELTDITFRAEPGETIGIIGGTGSGKSTLVSLIPRFYDAASGSVSVGGRDVRDYDSAELRSKIGYVQQKAVLFAGTIRDNLLQGNENATEEELWEALRNAQAEEFVRSKPGMLDEPVEQGGKNFSGGQRQRLSVARALVRKPEILVLDDASSALDFATDAALRKAIRGLEPRPTTFIVSQRASSILYADRILVLNDGALAGVGTHRELLEGCEVYREICRSQFRAEDEKEGC